MVWPLALGLLILRPCPRWRQRVPNHGEELADCAVVVTVDLLGKLKSHAPIYFHIGLVFAGLELASHLLPVRPVCPGCHELLADPLALSLRNDNHDI